jgi:hypothetical protein
MYPRISLLMALIAMPNTADAEFRFRAPLPATVAPRRSSRYRRSSPTFRFASHGCSYQNISALPDDAGGLEFVAGWPSNTELRGSPRGDEHNPGTVAGAGIGTTAATFSVYSGPSEEEFACVCRVVGRWFS